MHHLLQQTHVAQQSRREKLRIPGHSMSLPIQVREFPPDAERAHHIGSEGPLLGIVGGYSETSNQNTTNALLPLYSSHTISSDPYGLATGVELFAVPAKTDSTFCASPLGIGPQTPVTSGTIYSGQSLVTGGYYNKKNWLSNCGNWDTMNSEYSQFRSGGLQGVPVHTSSGASQHCLEATLLLGSLQSCAHKTSSKGGSIASCSLLDTKASPEAMQVYLMNHGASGYTGVPTTGNTVFVGPSNSVPLSPLPSGHHVQQNELENTFPTSQPSSYKSHRSIGGGSLPCYEIPSPQAAHLYDSLRSGDELLLLPSSHASSQAVKRLTDQGLTFQKLSQESFIEAGCRTRKDSFSTFPNQQEQLLQAESDDKCHGEIPLAGSASAHCLNLSLSSKRPLPMQIIGFDVQSEGENFLASQVDAKTLRQISIACTSDMNNLQLPVYGDYTQKMQDIANIYHGRQFQLEHNSPISPESLTFPSRNKYLKAARQLLDEVCSLKRDIVKHNAPKCQNTHIWTGQKLENMDFGSADAVLQGTSGKNQTIFAECIGKRLGPVLPVITENVRALNTEDRKECETKKEKLLLMLQELDRQYRIYTDQMNTVVASFDGVLGVGAAIPYTTLALQAMSRYFRCLRDAISGQILLVCRSLGEEDIARQITNRAGISRLRYVHSQFGQHHSFQQTGMLQPHAWRPQRGLPERSVSVLRAWLFEHFLHPYPKDADKMMLARQTGLTRSQVSNWFINARVRLWKPMVEEMYQEESREQEIGTSDRTCKNESLQDLNYTNMAAFDNKITSEGASDLQMLFEGDGLTSEFNAGNMLSTRHESIKAGLGYEAQLFGDTVVDGLSQVQIKKSRLEISSHSNLQSQSKSSEATTKFEDTNNDGMCGAENKTYQRQDSQLYNIPYSESVQQDGECLMPYGDSSLNRAFSSLYPVNGVSLTLGLRHSDNLSLSAARKAYLRTGGQSIAISRRQTVDTEDNDYCNNIYKGSGGQMINHQSTDYPNSKHIEVQI